MQARWLRLPLLAACISAALLSPRIGPVAAKATADVAPGEVIVKVASATDLPALAAAFGLDATPIDRLGQTNIYRMHIRDGVDPVQRSTELLGDPRVRYAEGNALGRAPEARGELSWAIGGDDGSYGTQWAAAKIRLSEAQRISTGAGVTVAVLDTGIDQNHPLFAGRLRSGYDFVDNDADPSEVGSHALNPAYGHGTHVAGLVRLAAPGAQLMPLRVLDANGVGDVWRIAKALLYAIDPDGNPATADGAAVINLSLGSTERSSLLREVINAVTCADTGVISPDDLTCQATNGRGAVVVVAAGNGGSSRPEYPAGDSLAGALTVGATTNTDATAAFSNRGSWVNLGAPGDHVQSAVPGGGYGSWSGTSMAAPLVAGTAALVRAAHPDHSVNDTTRQVLRSAVRVNGALTQRLDAAAAAGPTIASAGGGGGGSSGGGGGSGGSGGR